MEVTEQGHPVAYNGHTTGVIREVVEQTEWVAIATCGEDGPHLVTAWGDCVGSMGIENDRRKGPAGPAAQNGPSVATAGRPVTERERRAAIEGWKRLAREGKLYCRVNCPLGALGGCTMCGG